MEPPAFDPRRFELSQRLFPLLDEAGFRIGTCARPWGHWRQVPPFAFFTEWYGDDLTPAQQDLLIARQAFGRVIPQDTPPDVLVVYDMTPMPKPPILFHATRKEKYDDIMRDGLKPSRLTKSSNTEFPDAQRWVHLLDSVEATREKWLWHPGNKDRDAVPPGTYVILRVRTEGMSAVTADPYFDIGYTTPDDVIAPKFLSQVTEVGEIVVPRPIANPWP